MALQRNRITGEVREVPDAGGMSLSAPPQSMSSSGSMGGLPIDMLQQLLVMASLKSPKKASQYQTITNLLEGLRPESRMTAEQKNRGSLVDPALQTISSLKKQGHPKQSLLGSYASKFSLSKLGGRGVSSDVQRANAGYSLLRQNVVRALQGARMSDKDIELAVEYVPNIIDEPANAEAKLNILGDILNGVSSGQIVPGSVGSNTGGLSNNYLQSGY